MGITSGQSLASSLAGAERRVKIGRLKGAAIVNTRTDAETKLETQPVPSCAAARHTPTRIL